MSTHFPPFRNDLAQVSGVDFQPPFCFDIPYHISVDLLILQWYNRLCMASRAIVFLVVTFISRRFR